VFVWQEKHWFFSVAVTDPEVLVKLKPSISAKMPVAINIRCFIILSAGKGERSTPLFYETVG
jgi:transposase